MAMPFGSLAPAQPQSAAQPASFFSAGQSPQDEVLRMIAQWQREALQQAQARAAAQQQGQAFQPLQIGPAGR